MASTGDNNIDGEWFFEFVRNPSQRLPASGTDVLGAVTSWDFTFDPADQIVAVGLSYLGREQFQWFVSGNQPVLYARATFSDGSEARSEMNLQQEPPGGFDVFVGFEAPDGLVLTGLHLWHRGNNSRAFGNIDDFGLIAIPEPSAAALTIGLCALLLALRARRLR